MAAQTSSSTGTDAAAQAQRRWFGQTVRRAREAAGLSQRELAMALGLTPGNQTVSTWERGAATPSIERVALLAQVLAPHTTFEELSAPWTGQAQRQGESLAQMLRRIEAEVQAAQGRLLRESSDGSDN